MVFNIFKEFNKYFYENINNQKNKYYLFYNNLDYKIKGKYYIYNNIKYTSRSNILIDKNTLVAIIYI